MFHLGETLSDRSYSASSVCIFQLPQPYEVCFPLSHVRDHSVASSERSYPLPHLEDLHAIASSNPMRGS